MAVLVLFGGVAIAPEAKHWVSSRARYRGDFADPHYDVPIYGDSLHSAGDILRRAGGTYFVYAPEGAPVLLGNINGAFRLWAVPAVPLAYSNLRPDWVFSYRTRRLVPPGLRAVRVYRVGPGIRLVRIAG